MRLHRPFSRIFKTVLGVAFGVFAFSSADTHAQSTATLTGTLTDPSGAAVAGVQISATPLPDGEIIRAKSGADGRFTLVLPAGRYQVSLTHPSFAAVTLEFSLAANETREWNVRLELARLAASVVVTAEAEPTPYETASAPVNIITRQEIDQRQEVWLAPLLTSTPGASLARRGPLGGITTFFLDGGNSNFTKILVDGTPVNQPGGDVDFSNFDLDGVDKIEIVHGASSALFGSDAMTGVVQILTHRGSTRVPQLVLLGEGGSFSAGRGSGQLSGLLGRFDYSASSAYFSSNGQGPNDRFRDTTLSGNFGWRFSERDRLRLTLRNNSSDAGQPGQTLLEPPILNQSADLRNFSANLAWDFSSGDHWQYHLAGTEAYVRQLFTFPTFTVLNQFNRAGFNGQSSYLFPAGGISLGYQYEVENGAPNGPHARRNNQAGYVEGRYQFVVAERPLTVNAGARAEANDSFGTRVVPRLGLVYAVRSGDDFWGATRLRVSYGLGIKEPTFIQSFENDPCAPGNPNLKPERSETLNAGVEQLLASDRLRLSIDYFHNHFSDIVSFASGLPNSMCTFGTGSFFNTDSARAYGAHAAVEARPLPWLQVSGNYTYDDTRVLKAPNIFDPTLAPGNRLLKRPLHSANLILNAHFRRMNWNLAGYYVGRRTDSDFLSFTVNGVCQGPCITSNPSYVRWDLANSIELGHGVSTLARVENLFNRHYQDAIGYPALRLNYRLGMKFTWGGE